VLKVIAGVVVGVATVPFKPLAATTETVVTVPVLPAENGSVSRTIPLPEVESTAKTTDITTLQ
jgi:hypothetical protein